MKKFKKLLEKKWFAMTFALCVAVLVFLFFSNIRVFFEGCRVFWDIISPIVIGVVIAYLLNPIMVFFENKVFGRIKTYIVRHILGLVLTIICVLGALAVLLILLVPTIAESVVFFAAHLGEYKENAMRFIDSMSDITESFGIDVSGIVVGLIGNSEGIMSGIMSNISVVITTSIGVGTGIVKGLIAVILAIYFLAGKRMLINGIAKLRKSYLQDDTYKRHTEFFARCHRIFIRFIGCDLLDGLIIGIVNAVFMAIARMPFVSLISVIVGVCNLVPTFGPLVGAILGGLILVLVNPFYALGFIIFTIILQTLDGYIIKPKLFGDILGVPAVWVLIAIILGGAMFGVIGIIVSVPLVAILVFVYREYIIPYLLKKREQKRIRLENEKKEKED